jgi:uncharacterized membrane protein
MESFISMLHDTLHMNGQLFSFLVSIFPILELRGGLIAARLSNVPLWQAIPICIAGNFLPIPFILLFIQKLFKWLRKSRFTAIIKFVEFLENKAEKNAPKIMKHKRFGLTIFVGIPLPVTGAWTGAMVAGLFEFKLKESIPAILLGLCMASAIMTVITYVIPWIVVTLNVPSYVVITGICVIIALIIGVFILKSLLKNKKA